VPFQGVDPAPCILDLIGRAEQAIRDGQHVMAYRFPAHLTGEVVLPSKLGPPCSPAQHGARGWHAGGSTYRFQRFAIGQTITNPVGRLGCVEAWAAPLFLRCYQRAIVLDPLGVWWPVVVAVDGN
jgi:hypothetical protein